MSFGYSRSKASPRSFTSPGSCSIVVTAAVEPGTKTQAMPSEMPDLRTMSWTFVVMSTTSSRATVLSEMVPFAVGINYRARERVSRR